MLLVYLLPAQTASYISGSCELQFNISSVYQHVWGRCSEVSQGFGWILAIRLFPATKPSRAVNFHLVLFWDTLMKRVQKTPSSSTSSKHNTENYQHWKLLKKLTFRVHYIPSWIPKKLLHQINVGHSNKMLSLDKLCRSHNFLVWPIVTQSDLKIELFQQIFYWAPLPPVKDKDNALPKDLERNKLTCIHTSNKLQILHPLKCNILSFKEQLRKVWREGI